MEESIARQKAAVAQQAGAVAKQAGAAPPGGFFTVGWMGPPPVPAELEPECPAISVAEIEPLVAAAAKTRQVRPELLKAVIAAESGFRPCAVSEKGAMGLMQIMPGTAEKYEVADPFDPARNIDAGARYLKELLDRYRGNLKLSLAAYNAGPGRVDGSPPTVPDIPETRDYVNQIVQALGPAATPADSQGAAQ